MNRKREGEDNETYAQALDGLVQRGLVLDLGNGRLALSPRVYCEVGLADGKGIASISVSKEQCAVAQEERTPEEEKNTRGT